LLEPPAELLATVFPWVEQEQERLAQCRASSSKSDDIALKQFLRLLVWLRQVLLQDCAILFAKYPSCAMFRHPPFNNPTFHKFAASALSVVDQAEEDVRHALKNLPENIAATFRGLATDIKMDQHSQRIDTEARWDAVDGRLDQLTGLVQQLIGAKPSRGSQKSKRGSFFPPHLMFFCGVLIQMCVAVLNALQHMTLGPHDTFQAASSSSPPQPFTPSSAATIPNITINISNPSAGTPESGMTYAVAQPTNPLTHSAHSNPICNSTQQQPCVPKYQGQPMTPAQLTKWNSLIAKYGEVCVHKHAWDWVDGDFLPVYLYQSVSGLTDYWTEWMEGIGGYLPTRELTEVWGKKWRRNVPGQRTECGRRKRIIDLVSALSARPNWDVRLALRFLKENYGGLYSARNFSDWLKPENVQAVHVAAATYCR